MLAAQATTAYAAHTPEIRKMSALSWCMCGELSPRGSSTCLGVPQVASRMTQPPRKLSETARKKLQKAIVWEKYAPQVNAGRRTGKQPKPRGRPPSKLLGLANAALAVAAVAAAVPVTLSLPGAVRRRGKGLPKPEGTVTLRPRTLDRKVQQTEAEILQLKQPQQADYLSKLMGRRKLAPAVQKAGIRSAQDQRVDTLIADAAAQAVGATRNSRKRTAVAMEQATVQVAVPSFEVLQSQPRGTNTGTDGTPARERYQLVRQVKPLSDLIMLTLGDMLRYAWHRHLCHWQHAAQKQQADHAMSTHGVLLMSVDYSERFTLLMPYEAQSAFYNAAQVSNSRAL